MHNFLLDEQAFQVLKSFRPYFGDRGNNFLTALENVQELIKSEPAKKVAESLRFFGIGEKYASSEAKNVETNPYNLFLILSLMFAADMPGALPPQSNSAPDSVQEQLPVPILS